jgi:hypothetical protein
MASLQKTIPLKVEGIETIIKIVDAIELNKEMETLLIKMQYDLGGCKNIISPYRRRYGIELSSLLGAVLETYHQLRLKDD